MASSLSIRKRKAVAILMLVEVKKRRREEVQGHKPSTRTIWALPWILEREEKGAYHNLLQELRLQDKDNYRNFLRMDVNAFEELLGKFRFTF